MKPRKRTLNDCRPVMCACNDPVLGHAFAPVTKGYVVLVSKEDTDLLERQVWTASLSRGRRTVYAACYSKKDGSGKRHRYMHREVTSAGKGELVDHANGNGLDCRRDNLRKTDHKGNGRNNMFPIRKSKNLDLPRGVFFRGGRTKPYYVRIRDGQKQLMLGTYICPIEAARAYDEAARLLHGEFATLNNL